MPLQVPYHLQRYFNLKGRKTMAKINELTYEEKVDILNTYQDKSVKAHDIPKMYGISQQTMQEIVLEMGGQLRVPNNSKPRTKSGIKTCPKCHKKIELKGARFCPYCATDLRNENEILAEKVERLKNLFLSIPETERDFFIQTLCEVNAVLLKGDK